MKIAWGISISCMAGLFGAVFFLFQGGYILVKLPWFSYPGSVHRSEKAFEVSREIVCSVWKDGVVVEGKRKILMPSDHPADGIKRVVAAWLAAAVDEKAISEDVKILSVALTSQGTVALLDFDKTFMHSSLSTHDRSQLVESLLMTLRTAGVVLEGVYFLQGNLFLHDDYLDFSQRWPIGGYPPQ